MIDEATERLQEARRAVKGALASHITGRKLSGSNTFDGTVLPQVDRTRSWRGATSSSPFRKASRSIASFARSSIAVPQPLPREGSSTGERPKSLAFASLLTTGTPIRLTGQDTERGTFSHRHAVYHDVAARNVWIPLQHIAEHAGVVRNPKQPALRVRLRGIRVRILHPAIGSARSLGGAVRRLLQRRADHRRSVHRGGASEVGTDLPANAASSARATKVPARNTPARVRSAFCSSSRKATCASPRRRLQATTITCCGRRRARRSPSRWSF